MKYCPQCEHEYPAGEKCPADQTPLIDQSPRPDPLLGMLVEGRYRIEEKVARGGMGTVFRAKDEQKKRDVAVKVLHANLQEQPDAVKRFFREARALASLKHPNIVESYGSGQIETGQLYMVMEFLHGQTLEQLVRTRGPLPVALITSLLTQICHAVTAAHAAKVIHRDLTPMNILLARKPGSQDEVVKIVDFGIAKNSETTTQITQAGIVMGTPGYLAPEQITGESQADPRSDVYAIGALLYFMLAGKRPYTALSPQAILAKQLSEPPEHFDLEKFGLALGLRDVLLRAFAKKPANRFQSPQELLSAYLAAVGTQAPKERELNKALQAYRKTSKVGTNVSDFGLPIETSTRRERVEYILAAALLLFAVCLAEWLVRDFSDVPWLITQAPAPAATAVRGVLPDKIVVGVSADLSGTTRAAGRALVTGMKTAFAAVNDDEGGVYGRRLELVVLDDNAAPDVAGQNAKALLEKYNSFAVIGGLGTATTQAVLPEAIIANSVVFAPVSGASALRDAPVPKHLFFYRPTYAQEARALVEYLINDRAVEPQQIAVFHEQGPGGEDCAAAVRKTLREHGATEDVLETFYLRASEDVTDAAGELYKNARKLKALVLCADALPALKLLQQLGDKKVKLLTAGISNMGGVAVEDKVLGKRLLPGVITSQVVPPLSSNNPFVGKFIAYLNKYHPGSEADAITFEGYVLARLFAMAMKLVGPQPTTEALIKAIESMRDVEFGIGSPIKFSATNHQGSNAIWLSTWNAALEQSPLSPEPSIVPQ
jgi:ABC-type branched-subunit amino acid transport system substrate-binding protein